MREHLGCNADATDLRNLQKHKDLGKSFPLRSVQLGRPRRKKFRLAAEPPPIQRLVRWETDGRSDARRGNQLDGGGDPLAHALAADKGEDFEETRADRFARH